MDTHQLARRPGKRILGDHYQAHDFHGEYCQQSALRYVVTTLSREPQGDEDVSSKADCCELEPGAQLLHVEPVSVLELGELDRDVADLLPEEIEGVTELHLETVTDGSQQSDKG